MGGPVNNRARSQKPGTKIEERWQMTENREQMTDHR